MPRRRPRGLTFLEIEMALLLLLLGVLTVIEIAPLALRGVRQAEQQAMGGQFAQHILETELNCTYAAALSRVNTSSFTQDSWIVPAAKYQRSSPPYSDIVIPGAPLLKVDASTPNGTGTLPMYTYFVDRRGHPTLGTDVIVITVEVKYRDPSARQTKHIFRLVGYKTR